MSYNNKRQAATSGMSQTRFNQEAASGGLNSASQLATRLSSPNSRILDELLALGTSNSTSSGGNELRGQRASNSSCIDNQSNITIIDYRQGAPVAPTGPLGLNLADGFAQIQTAAPSTEKSQRNRPINKFDQFASQFKSSLGLGDRRRSRPGNSNTDPIQTFGLQQTLPALVPIPLTAGNVKILDIRRTKTDRRRPKRNCANRLSRDYENVMPCQLARDDDDEDEDDYDEQDDDKNRLDQAKDRQANQSDHLQDQTDTSTTRNKNQPKQQQQQQQQQRQQSGETLSSFESDYDLLVYLGETETEDLVETERSLDYLDQTWRQSICGGASLAPTIDESLSELLQTPQSRFGGSSPRAPLVENNDDFDQLWTQTNTAGPRARGRQQQQDGASTLNFRSGSNNRLTPGQQQQQPNRDDQTNLLADLSYGNINQTRWSTSLPRSQSRHNSSGQLAAGKSFAQSQVRSPSRRGLEVNELELANEPALVSQLEVKRPSSQQGPSLAVNISNKLASLFKPNQTRQQQQTDQRIGPGQRSAAGGLTKQEAETVRQLNEFLEQARLGSKPMEAPQKPRRRQGAADAGGAFNNHRPQDGENADELDRLLAEMSQSLDLDSLARYDPYSTRGARQQESKVKVPMAASRSGELVTQQRRQSPSKTENATRRQANGPQTQPMGRNEFILNEYDGASKMLEQMINDQLDEAQLVTGNSRNRVAQRSTDRIGQNNSTSGPTSDDDRGSSASQARKISSTCSTTTETSVVPSANRGQRATTTRTIPIEVLASPPRDEAPKEVRKKGQVLTNITHQMSLDTPAKGDKEAHTEQNRRRPPNYSRSLEAAGEEQAAVLIEPKARTILTKPLTPPVSSKASTSSMEVVDEDDGREVTSPPPPPPVVDYNDFNENEHELKRDKINFNKQNFKLVQNEPETSRDQNQLIQVEPNEIPSPTSSEDEQPNRPISSGRHKRVMNQMKRRTMSGVRSVRQQLGRRFQGGATSTDATIKPTNGAATAQTERDHTNPLPPPRSSSIGSSTKSVAGSRRNETEELAAESPRQSRQRSRRKMANEMVESDKQQPPVELAGGKKSFGQQIRDRLGRSKSRLSNFLRPLSLHRPQQEQEVASDDEEETKRPEVPLFQPSDIARNEPTLRGVGESSLERQLRADLCEQIKPSDGSNLTPRTGPKRSPSGRSHDSEKSLGSSELSGLETVAPNNRSDRLFDNLPIGRSKSSSKRKSRQTKRGADRSDVNNGKRQQKRPTSLMSLKRFGESFGGSRNKSAASERGNSAERVHDLVLEQQMTNGAAAAVHHRRAARGNNRRLGNRSTGDQLNSPTEQETAIKSLTPSRAITDDYFGFKAPLKTSPVAGNQSDGVPSKLKSLEVHQRVEMGPRVRPASALVVLNDTETGQQQHRIFGRRRPRVAPNRSQSLKGTDFTAARPDTTLRPMATHDTGSKQSDRSLDRMNSQSSRQKSVSFQNLAHDQSANQRRPLSPVSPNTFRPVSASPGQAPEFEGNKSFSALMTETHRAELGAITPIQLTPILSNHSQAAPTAPARARSPQVPSQVEASSPTGPKHDRGSVLLQDLRNKCTDLFGPNSGKRSSKAAPTQVATTSCLAESTPPSRPPRTRKRRDPAAPFSVQATTRSKSLAAPVTLSVTELQPTSSPPASPFAATSESPDSHRRPRRANTVKRLTNFAQQLRTSATDFFAARPPAQLGPPKQAASRIEPTTFVAPSQQRTTQSTSSATTTTTVQSRFRNLDEPLLQRDLAQWRPIIPIGGQKPRDKVVRRSSSFRLAKDDDDQTQIVASGRSRTLAGAVNQAYHTKVARADDEGQDDSYSDSTWDSSSNDDDDDRNKVKRTANRNIQRRAHNRTKATRRPDDSSPAASETADGEEGQQVLGLNRRAGFRLAAAASGNEQMRAAAASSSSNIGSNNKNNADDQDLNNNNRNSNQTIDGRNLRHLQHKGEANDTTTGQFGGANLDARAPLGASSCVTRGPNENGSCKPLLGNNKSDCLRESREAGSSKHIAQVSCSVNERAFKFNENLPSPSQILSELKRDSDESESSLNKTLKGGQLEANEMTATRNARRGRVVSCDENQLDGSKKSKSPPVEQGQEQNDPNTNRLSVYENVSPQDRSKPQVAPRGGASRVVSQIQDGNQLISQEPQRAKNNETNRTDEAIGQSKTTLRMTNVDKGKKREPTATRPRREDANSAVDDENSQQDDWSVEPVDQLNTKTRNLSNLRQQVAATEMKSVAGAENGANESLGRKSAEQSTMKPTVCSELVRPANARRAERKLVPMTSIINEPEDELMNLAANSSIVRTNELTQDSPPATTGDDQRRRQSNFSLQNGNSDNDDSESSLSLGCGRRRLESKLTRQREQQASSRAQTKLTSKPPVPSRPPNLPRATGPAAGCGGSLVRRLARNFDQAVLQHQQPKLRNAAVLGRTNVVQQSAGARPSPPRAQQLHDLVDEPKSDSTWYDAKSVELLDEAEVAELLREFENDGQTNQQSDSDQYVTLSQDQPGRRDRAHERLSGGADDDDDDATLNDDETLNDANEDDDDDGDLLDASQGRDEESVYVSAAAATNENDSRLQRSSRDGAGGNISDNHTRLDVGSSSDNEKMFRGLLVGGADRSRHSGCDGAVVVVDVDERLRDDDDAAATRRGRDEREACSSRGGCSDGGQLLGQRVAPTQMAATSKLNDETTTTTRQLRTNENADLNSMPTTSCVTQPGQSSPKPQPTTNATLVNQQAANDDDKAEQMKEVQLEVGQVGDQDDRLQDQRQLFTGRLFKVFDVNKTPVDVTINDKKQLEDGKLGKDDQVASQQVDNEQSDDEDESSSAAVAQNINSAESSSCREDLISLSSSSLSSESMPELRQRKNLQRLYNIVNEICTSEEKFLATLRLLNEDFRRHILTSLVQSNSIRPDYQNQPQTDSILMQQPPFDCIGLVMKHLPQLQALNQNLYDELRQARNQWPSTQKISHVLVKIGPFLKHYSSYIRDFECIQQQFQENLKKSSQFRETIKQFERDEADKCSHLSIQHHLLKPIQRIPQYRLLLQQYLHHLKPDDADYEDTVSALEVVSRVAEHANQSLSEGANFAKLLSLQAKIVGGKQRDIVQPGRLFLKEGELLKVCRKQIQPRWFVLLSDALFYLKQIQSNDILYLKYELPLDDCQVELPSGSGQSSSSQLKSCTIKEETTDQEEPVAESAVNECELNICTTVRSMTLVAKSRQERDDWFQALKSAIESHVAKRRSFRPGQQQLDLLQEPFNGLIGRKAPIWTPDSRVNTCQLCTSNFSALFRRHHCRACGRVVCSACSSNKAPLIYLKCRAARVCDQCFESLRANMHLYYLPSCRIDERELRRLDEHFKTLLKSQFVKKRMFASSKAPKVVLLKGPNRTSSKSATDLRSLACDGGSKE